MSLYQWPRTASWTRRNTPKCVLHKQRHRICALTSSEINSSCWQGMGLVGPWLDSHGEMAQRKEMAIVKLGQTGFSQVKQVLEALRGLGRSCSPGGLAVDSPIWPCPLQGAHGNVWMGGGMSNSSLPQPPLHRTSCWADGNHPSCPPCQPDLVRFIRLGEKYKAIVISSQWPVTSVLQSWPSTGLEREWG